MREAVTEVAARRRRAADPSLEHLGEQPWEVLDYLARHPALRPEDAAADGQAALVLLADLRWRLVEHEYRHLARLDQLPTAVRPSNATVGAWLGSELGKQGVADRRDRDAALLQHGPAHNEHHTREARAATRADDRQAADEDARLAEHAATLHTLRQRLLHTTAQRALDREGRDWLCEVERDHREHDCSRQALTVLALAVRLIEDHTVGEHDLEIDMVCSEFRTLRAAVRGQGLEEHRTGGQR